VNREASRHGKPIVRLVAARAGRGGEARRKASAVRRIERMREELGIRGVDIRKLIEEGRR